MAGIGSKAAKTRPGYPVDPYRLRRAVARYKWLVFGAGAIGLVIGYAIAKLGMTSGYESSAVLRFEGYQQIEGIQGDQALGAAAGALHRQAVLRRIAEEVEFPGPLMALRGLLPYRVYHMDRTMELQAPGETPEDAAMFADIASQIFIQYHEERAARRIEVEIRGVQKRIVAAEQAAEVARKRYNEFRETHGIADLSTEQESTLEAAARLRAEAELGVSEVRALEAQVRSLEAQLAATPKTTVVGSGVTPERAAYNKLSQELATARASLSEEHPQVQALQQQVNQLRAQARARGGSGSGSGLLSVNATHQAIEGQLRAARSDLRALRERQIGLSQLADKSQRRIEDFSEIEGEASSLLSEVKVNESLIESLRKTEAALEDALHNPSSGFVVLQRGSVPEYPVANKMKVVVFGSVPLVLFSLALLFALYREFNGFRVQTAAEVAFWGSGPVVGTTSWPDDPHGLEELVAGLDDYAPEARGTVLILSAAPEESSLGVELARRMNDDWVIASGASKPPAEAPGPSVAAREVRPAGMEPVAVQTPPPSAPYPLKRTQPPTALARRPTARPVEYIHAEGRTERVHLDAWDGPFEGQALRRAARLADRVLVLAHSNQISMLSLNRTAHRLGRDSGIGYVVVGLPEELHALADRYGDIAHFWGVRG